MLTDKQEIFCREYLMHFNATDAYVKAGYVVKNRNTAKTLGSKLLTNIDVQKKISELKEVRLEKSEINMQWVLDQQIEIFEMAKGTKPITITNDGQTQKVHITNLREANKALELIGKHTNIKAFDKEIDLKGSAIFTIAVPEELE